MGFIRCNTNNKARVVGEHPWLGFAARSYFDEPAKDPNLQGGKRLNASLEVTFHPSNEFFKGQQFLVQGDVPVMQSLDGPQLKRSYMLRVAWQWGF